MKQKFHYVYILKSLKDGLFYIGFSTDLKRRLQEHNSGKNISTSRRLPLQLIYYEAFLSRTDASQRERYFKTSKGKTTLRLMLKEFLSNTAAG
ncbi:MAG: GIY-YIG nuclease family protein [Patescibacteria group bacterium]